MDAIVRELIKNAFITSCIRSCGGVKKGASVPSHGEQEIYVPSACIYVLMGLL